MTFLVNENKIKEKSTYGVERTCDVIVFYAQPNYTARDYGFNYFKAYIVRIDAVNSLWYETETGRKKQQNWFVKKNKSSCNATLTKQLSRIFPVESKPQY